MPTARPSMSDSIGVVDVTGPKMVATKISAIEIPTPRRAVRSGMPAATKEPNVMMRTMSATTRPISSTMLSVGSP